MSKTIAVPFERFEQRIVYVLFDQYLSSMEISEQKPLDNSIDYKECILIVSLNDEL
jgi:hypothetical protein